MSSGVATNDACLTTFEDLKLKHKYAYIIYALNATNTEIVVESTAAPGTTYDAFLSALPSDECRYAVYDVEFTKEDGGVRNKICFFAWSPDSAKVKNKMLYASSKDALRRKLVGVAAEIQGTDLSEVSFEAVMDKVNRGN